MLKLKLCYLQKYE